MIRRARAPWIAPLALAFCVLVAPVGGLAGDEIFERDLSTPFLRDDDDRFGRDRDLPGPLRKAWPYTNSPEIPFKAVEARRACHARALFEWRQSGGAVGKALERLQSERDGALRFSVSGRYQVTRDGTAQNITVFCIVSSREVVSIVMKPVP